MNKIIRNALAALVVATAGLAASAPAATAGGIGFEFSIGGPGGGVIVRDHGRDMGVRRADVVRAGHRRVVVEGFRHHRPVRVIFANERHCPVIGFRR